MPIFALTELLRLADSDQQRLQHRGIDRLLGRDQGYPASHRRHLAGSLQRQFRPATVGSQGSYTQRRAFEGVGGAPTTDAAVVLTSFRYYPF
jgi:hypothetical protein